MSYQELFLILQHPIIARNAATPTNPQDWKRFFGMMDTLERAEIAVFEKGRYTLHPKQAAKQAAKKVLASMSKSLSLPEQYVHINMTGRGMSSGKYELLRQEEKYGRVWNVVKFTSPREIVHHIDPKFCELVVG